MGEGVWVWVWVWRRSALSARAPRLTHCVTRDMDVCVSDMDVYVRDMDVCMCVIVHASMCTWRCVYMLHIHT